MTWEQLSEAHRDAAKWLMGSGNVLHHRAICGRAYYATYALVTSKLPPGTRFGNGWQNPEHAKLPIYVNQIAGLEVNQKRRIKTAIHRLRQRREDSDYRPGLTVSKSDALEALRDVEEVRWILSGGKDG